MPRKPDPNKKVQMTVRIKPDLRDQAREVADGDDMSLSELVGRAVESFLDGKRSQAA